MEIPFKEKLSAECDESYFATLKKLRDICTLKDFESLDNLLWLIGKIKNGSFSLILSEEKYKALVLNRIDPNEDIDKQIKSIIYHDIDKLKDENVFTSKEYEFIKFVMKIDKKKT